MRTLDNLFWVFYFNDNHIDLNSNKCGKWMYFFNNKEFAASICVDAVKNNIVQVAKHSNNERGVVCFYLECDDMQAHKRVIDFMLQNNLIQKTKEGKLYNISFKLDNQTRANEYGNKFKAKISLSDFIDLHTGEWKN